MNFKAFKKVFLRECKRMVTSTDLLLICFAAPLFYCLVFSFIYIYKRPSDINIGIINMDNSAMSRKLVQNFDAAPEFKVNKMYASTYEAYMGIFHNNLSAFYFIPKNFSADLKKGKSSSAFNAANSSTFIISSTVLKKLAETTADFSKKQFTKVLVDKGYSYKAAKAAYEPLKTDTRYLFNPGTTYSDFLLPCLLLAVLQQILLVGVCTTMSSERSEGTFDELLEIAGGKFSIIFIGKALPYILLGIILNMINIYFILPINDIYAQSFLSLTLISVTFIIALVFFSILVSFLFSSPEMALAVLMFYALPVVLLSGFAWPHHALPGILKVVSFLFPSTYAFNSIRLYILGYTPVKYALPYSVLLIIFAVLCYCFSYIIELKIRSRTLIHKPGTN